jgi:shikimate dehydrogenase
MTTRVALIGDPVSGSVSPQMHRAGFREAGLDWDYRAIRVGSQELPHVFPRLRSSLAGLNVTHPLKESILPLLDRLSGEAERAGSVNTVVFGDEVWGHSTDGAGFVSALRRSADRDPRRAVILGTGGAARAVAEALTGLGADVTMYGRNVWAGTRLAGDLGVSFAGPAGEGGDGGSLPAADLLVNATPVGGGADPEALPVPASWALHEGLTVFDLVYRPRRTALLRLAETAGCRTVEGIEMLIEQGALSFEVWTGRPGPVEAMREAAYRALDDAGSAGSKDQAPAPARGVR